MQKGDYTEDEILKDLPRGVALSWGLVKEPQRGPKREMNIDAIVDAAVAIADKEGLAAVSMNRVAQSLGFTAMSLYRYIPGKEDLLLLMQETVCDVGPLAVSEDADWRERMREYVRWTIDIFRAHPWYGDIPISSVPVTPNHLRIVDWALRTTRGMALTDYEKMSIVLLLSGYARSCGLIQRDMDRAEQAGVSHETFSGLSYTKALKKLVQPEQYPDLHPIIQSGAYTEEVPNEAGPTDDFEFGLERILDGIQQYLNVRKQK
jgi:AcrR family transcriptional regulator